MGRHRPAAKASRTVKSLQDEIARRFPEIPAYQIDANKDAPSLLMHEVVNWLRRIGTNGLTPEIVQRVVDFSQWCENQPRGSTTEDDLFTIYITAFVEHLFESEVTRPLIPKLCNYGDLMSNADYLKRWVGEENYALALKEYDVRSRHKR